MDEDTATPPAGTVLSVELTEAAPRLDKALAEAVPAEAALSRARLRTLIETGAVARASGETVRDPRARVKPGEVWTIRVPPPTDPVPRAEAIPLSIVHEDDDLIVLDKPAGMVVHPAPGAESGTLVNALLAHCGEALSGIGGVRRPGIVHRIDKDTSGLIVVAKTDLAHQGLAAQFAAHDLERSYLALCHGVPDPASARLRGLPDVELTAGRLTIAAAIGRHPTDRTRMAAVRRGGRAAVTRVAVEERFAAEQRAVAALLTCRLETGRTHQIRVHLSHIGHPLIGDPVYGARRRAASGLSPDLAERIDSFPRQALHAATLGFVHPRSRASLRFEAPPPEDFATLLSALRRSGAAPTYKD
ncbi:MAG: RluA family pseudouridine synthase [Pseudomonadota bacterium]